MSYRTKLGVTSLALSVVGLGGLALADTLSFDPNDDSRWACDEPNNPGCMGHKIECRGFEKTFVFRKKDVCFAQGYDYKHPVPCNAPYGSPKERGFVISFATCTAEKLGFRYDKDQTYTTVWCGNQQIGRVSNTTLVAQDFYPEGSTNKDGSQRWYRGFFRGSFRTCQTSD